MTAEFREEPPDYDREPATPAERQATALLVSRMTVPEKIAAAMKGTREMRVLLVQDASRIVAMSVMGSPKLTDSEVEQFARLPRVSEEVLRTIGLSRVWTKHYPTVVALVRNAKTPLAISMTLLSRLTSRDLRFVAVDRNIPDPLRLTARRRVADT